MIASPERGGGPPLGGGEVFYYDVFGI
jgi:hypothetical protein